MNLIERLMAAVLCVGLLLVSGGRGWAQEAASDAVDAAVDSGADSIASEPPSLSEPIGGDVAPVQPAEETATEPLSGITTVPAQPLPPEEPTAVEPVDQAAPDGDEVIVPPEPVASVENANSAAITEPSSAASPNTPQTQPEKKPNGFATFSFSPQIGYAFFSKGDYEYNGIPLTVDQRNSFVLKLHLDLGGDGLAFEIAPLIATEKIGGDLSSFNSDLSSGVSGNLFAVGSQLNLVVRGSWGSFYPHLGIGFHGTYLTGDDIEYGAELYGRIPAGFTWYLAKHFGLVMEFAFTFGATGMRGKVPDTAELYAELEQDYGLSQTDIESIDWQNMDWQNADRTQIATELGVPADAVDTIIEDQISKVIKFGRGYGLEFMIGFRFP